jgi:hypothetical protein
LSRQSRIGRFSIEKKIPKKTFPAMVESAAEAFAPVAVLARGAAAPPAAECRLEPAFRS